MPEYDNPTYDAAKYEAHKKLVREIDQQVTDYADAMVKERFICQYLAEPKFLHAQLGWEHFAFTFRSVIGPYFVPEQPAEWVRELMRDLWVFCALNQSGSPGYRFAALIQGLAPSKVRQCGVPAEVEQCFQMIREWAEIELERQGQMGY